MGCMEGCNCAVDGGGGRVEVEVAKICLIGGGR